MASLTATPGALDQNRAGASPQGDGIVSRILKYALLMVLDAFALILIYSLIFDGATSLAIVIGIVTVFVNVVVFTPSLSPVRWMTPGLAFVILLAIYPIFFTVTTAFTNYSDGNLLPKEQAVALIQQQDRSFVSADAIEYEWQAYQAADGSYALWMTRELEDGSVETVFAPAEQPIMAVEGTFDEPPAEYEGYTLLDRAGRTRALSALRDTTFGTGEDTAGVIGRSEAARPTLPRYVYDPAADTITDQADNTVYRADEEIGAFVPVNGSADNALQPGYRVYVGLDNFERFASDPSLRGPLLDIFSWTVVFAGLSVLTTFALGLSMALVLNDPAIPARKIIRSILLIPYAIPGVISIVVWRGMLNQNLGIINDLFNSNVAWLNDPFWAKFSIIFVNLWLGYPYMMLICSGALQSIPSEVYEASSVDGANPWQKFWNITLPLLLIAVGPLLIGSFTFNFNNYLLITALTGGNPPILGSPVPAGQTDILISYVYKSAFSNQADYGYASAITIIIFFIVAGVTLMQYRFTRTLEQVSENV
jgi:ABC-type sugar transport system permease subunit